MSSSICYRHYTHVVYRLTYKQNTHAHLKEIDIMCKQYKKCVKNVKISPDDKHEKDNI